MIDSYFACKDNSCVRQYIYALFAEIFCCNALNMNEWAEFQLDIVCFGHLVVWRLAVNWFWLRNQYPLDLQCYYCYV